MDLEEVEFLKNLYQALLTKYEELARKVDSMIPKEVVVIRDILLFQYYRDFDVSDNSDEFLELSKEISKDNEKDATNVAWEIYNELKLCKCA